jgi:general secretion pathway protein K
MMKINNNRGVALVITLLVLALLITVILEFNLGMRVEAKAAANFRDDTKAYYLARSGIIFAIELLEEDKKTSSQYDSLIELWAQKVPPIPVGDGFVQVEVNDEDRKINLNKLATGFGTVTGDRMRAYMTRFLEIFELKEEITDSITDWIDTDDIERIGGAESSYYESLEESYEAKNNQLDSLQEIRMIKGIDDEVFKKIKDFLAVHSDGKINVNTASKEVLMSLSEDLTGDIADEIIAFRLENPFQQVADVKNNISISDHVYNEISGFIDIKSNYFSISSTGEVNQSRKTINARIERSGTKSKIKYWRVE